MFQKTNPASSIKKVCIIGPECTGKSELATVLAKYYQTACVAEYARAYLNKLGRPYEQYDLTKIAHGQVRMEDEWMSEAKRVLVCDTNLLVIKIWSEHKYGNCDKEILELIKNRSYDLYLLTYIDVPWEADPQREHPDKREHFWHLYKNEITHSGIPFIEIAGTRDERMQKSIAAIDTMLAKS